MTFISRYFCFLLYEVWLSEQRSELVYLAATGLKRSELTRWQSPVFKDTIQASEQRPGSTHAIGMGQGTAARVLLSAKLARQAIGTRGNKATDPSDASRAIAAGNSPLFKKKKKTQNFWYKKTILC